MGKCSKRRRRENRVFQYGKPLVDVGYISGERLPAGFRVRGDICKKRLQSLVGMGGKVVKQKKKWKFVSATSRCLSRDESDQE